VAKSFWSKANMAPRWGESVQQPLAATQFLPLRGSTVGTRETVEAISWDYAPLEPFQEGADDYLLSVSAEVGVVLRLASRLGGEEFDVFEMVDLVFDEAFAEGTFRLELPSVKFERVDR
jgi:hypothetical protein